MNLKEAREVLAHWSNKDGKAYLRVPEFLFADALRAALAECDRLTKGRDAIREFVDRQKSLPPEFAKVLQDHWWELMDDKAKP